MPEPTPEPNELPRVRQRPPFRIKICGVTTPQDAIDLVESGADAIGLNFYQKSSRYVSPERAKVVIDALAQWMPTPRRHRPNDSNQQGEAVKGTPAKLNTCTPRNPSGEPVAPVKRIGVFVNQTLDQILEITRQIPLDGVQLHGDEPPDLLRRLKQAWPHSTSPPSTIRAIRSRPVPSSGAALASESASPVLTPTLHESKLDEEQTRVLREIQAWESVGVDLILLDAADPGSFGGTGKSIDWTMVPFFQNQTSKTIVLAGGLRPDNVQMAILASRAQVIDVASGVEDRPGSKSPELMRQFVQQANQAWQSSADA